MNLRGDLKPGRTGFRPEKADFRPERADSRPERADSRPERADFRPERAGSRPERADIRPERADFRPERTDFRPERVWGGGRTDGRTDRRTNEQKSPVFYRTSSPSGPLPKNRILESITRTLNLTKVVSTMAVFPSFHLSQVFLSTPLPIYYGCIKKSHYEARI